MYWKAGWGRVIGMRSLLYTAVEHLAITEQMISEISGYSFFVGGIILAVMILKRRMAFRGACLKLQSPIRLEVPNQSEQNV